ncbi:MAG TPA: hypothetical protein VGK49_03000 [Ilumatobacteraceae bacterium]
MPGPYRRIDHPNPNSFVVQAVDAPKKPKAAKKAAEPPPAVKPESVAVDNTATVVEPPSGEPA